MKKFGHILVGFLFEYKGEIYEKTAIGYGFMISLPNRLYTEFDIDDIIKPVSFYKLKERMK